VRDFEIFLFKDIFDNKVTPSRDTGIIWWYAGLKIFIQRHILTIKSLRDTGIIRWYAGSSKMYLKRRTSFFFQLVG